MLLSKTELLLEPGVDAPSAARRGLDGFREAVGGERFEDLRLLVTELVTNSVVHASLGPGDRIRLRLAVSAEMVRVRVDDPGPGFESPPDGRGPPDETRASGRGLYLVDGLADRWGVVRDGCTGVWFEIDLPG